MAAEIVRTVKEIDELATALPGAGKTEAQQTARLRQLDAEGAALTVELIAAAADAEGVLANVAALVRAVSEARIAALVSGTQQTPLPESSSL
jgi:hypothetical protein